MSRSSSSRPVPIRLNPKFARGSGKRDWIEHDPDYTSLRDHPRFQAMVARLK